MSVPEKPKIYHILHIDKLSSVIKDGYLRCDKKISQSPIIGTNIGLNSIKERRRKLKLKSHEDLHVGDCVPFYFCPRSVMLYLVYKGDNPELNYNNGQDYIIHLQADLKRTVEWAEENNKRWAYTTTNAGSFFFEDMNDLNKLSKIDWEAIESRYWQNCKETKQAEFLIEDCFPFCLVECIGVYSLQIYQEILEILPAEMQETLLTIKEEWYY
ncbi:type II toxin-antitoxin system toxin DNA ADP-ribosyl transferase DarT [Flexistipes sp.]|uniref:type II toxin-antitoxin system toxin DNA ADP-ribosyl transferase DarT n=1 Tax=Flexistipes sp. TaxID=3088135 RepID=UPI002E228DCC|nr:DUF4433 domain-containing protein [Flexistipes sp.]